jgi:hypothetical protein
METPTNTETDQGIFVPNEDAATETATPPEYGPIPDSVGRICPKCNRLFKSAPALRMHEIRKHGKGWSTAGNFQHKRKAEAKKQYKSNSAAYRKKQYQELQAYYRSKGLDSHGQPYKSAKGRRIAQGTREAMMRKVGSQMFDAGGKPPAPKPAPPVSSVTFCPRCGCNIKVVAAAIAFGDNQ